MPILENSNRKRLKIEERKIDIETTLRIIPKDRENIHRKIRRMKNQNLIRGKEKGAHRAKIEIPTKTIECLKGKNPIRKRKFPKIEVLNLISNQKVKNQKWVSSFQKFLATNS